MKRILFLLFCLLSAFACGLYYLLPPFNVSAQGVSAPATLQTTLGNGATEISSTVQLVYQVMLQNNAAHSMRCGDSNVTSSRGALLAASGGTVNFTAQMYLSQLYCVGTQGDVVDVIYVH